MRYIGTQTRIGVLVPKQGSIKPTVSLNKEAKQYLSWGLLPVAWQECIVSLSTL